MSDADKAQLTEAEIRTRYITPALSAAGWPVTSLREEFYYLSILDTIQTGILELNSALESQVSSVEPVRARCGSRRCGGGLWLRWGVSARMGGFVPADTVSSVVPASL